MVYCDVFVLFCSNYLRRAFEDSVQGDGSNISYIYIYICIP